MIGSSRHLAAWRVLALCTSVMSSAQLGAQSLSYGSESGSTYRGCGTATATQACDGTGSGQGIIRSVNTGGDAQIANTDLTLADGSFARATVSFDSLRLPQIHSETKAVGNERLNSNTIAYQSYTWTGASSIDFSIAGLLHVDDASQSQADQGGVAGGVLPGGAVYFASLLILDPSRIVGLTADNFYTNIFSTGCGDAGVLGEGSVGGTLNGSGSFALATSACGASSLTLAPGQQVVLAAKLQLPVNRGGFASALHTFSTSFDPSLGGATIAALERGLVPSIPEPGTWALMLAGFGMIAGSLRYRRRSGNIVFG